MPKSSPDRLAQALRANLKRRKAAPGTTAPDPKAQAPAESPEKAPGDPGQGLLAPRPTQA